MAEIHRATLTPTKVELLQPWLGAQRWFSGKGRDPQLTIAGGFRFDDPGGEVGIEIMLVVDSSGGADVLYQVPVTYRAGPLEGADSALIGRLEHSVLGTRWVYDGCHDPAYAAALLHAILAGGTQAQLRVSGTDEVLTPTITARGSGSPQSSVPVVAASRVLSGEQSNTSIICDIQDATPLILKVFRVLHAGDNPDVELQGMLTAAGSSRVPSVVGSLRGSWPDETAVDALAHGHLAVVQEFFPGVQDAWREALVSARNGSDFTGAARGLGGATAEVHRALAEVLPTVTATPEHRQAWLVGVRARYTAACSEVSELAGADGVEELYQAAAKASWPPLQRIHGDYHLGQVLDVAGRGWVLLDFEGEPLRTLAERSLPDLTLRDIAGMLRSFDYAAGSVALTEGEDRTAWAHEAREAFLAGYTEVSGQDPRADEILLNALELDKALYEVVYEARNRPTWISIPITAVARLTAGPRSPSVPSTHNATPLPKAVEELSRVVDGRHPDPHSVLGAHPSKGGVSIRVLRPLAARITAELADGTRFPLTHEFHGIWAGAVALEHVPDYRLLVDYGDGIEHRQDDPYRFLPSLGEIDLHLIGEGRHERLWTVLGSHVRNYDGPMGDVRGTSFAVWAPHAGAVRVIGDFNFWDGSQHPMRSLGPTGVWELFIPGVDAGNRYKYEILGSDHVVHVKADPLARAAEQPPASASVVTSSTYEWGDDEWLTGRAASSAHNSPMSVYEVHLGSWRQGESYRDLADHLVGYVKDLGFTHIELMPVMEHPYGPSWGYQVTGYYAPTARYGSPDDFRYFVDMMHRNGIGVLLDWVPAHFPKDSFGLARFDGQALYEHPDPRLGEQPDWGTQIFNFGHPQVRNFLVANALYWLEEFHADGLRIDAVSSMIYLDYSRQPGEWVPNVRGGREHLEAVQLLQEANATAYKRVPGIVTIAEESTSWPGVTRSTNQDGLGFGLKWNMGWMHDSLDYMSEEPVHRQHHHTAMTFPLMYAWTENFVLPISHDEVVYGKGSLLRKMPGDRAHQLANVRAYLGYMWSQPGKQLLFMGSEFAQESEWAEGRSLDWWLLQQPAHAGVHSLVRDLNGIYRSRPALWQLDSDPSGFRWLDADDAAGNTVSYLRLAEPDELGDTGAIAALMNFSGQMRQGLRVGLPVGGRWNEIINTDAHDYGGNGVGNLGSVTTEDVPHQGQPYSALVTLPALSTIWLEPDAEESETDPPGTPDS